MYVSNNCLVFYFSRLFGVQQQHRLTNIVKLKIFNTNDLK